MRATPRSLSFKTSQGNLSALRMIIISGVGGKFADGVDFSHILVSPLDKDPQATAFETKLHDYVH